MFGYYLLPSDDKGPNTGVVTVSPGGSPSDEDPDYVGENLFSGNPSRPAKLTTTSGYWEKVYSSPIAVIGAAVIYHNFDAGLDVTIEGGSGSPGPFSESFVIPTHREDGWTISPWVLFDSVQTWDTWRLSVNGTNSLPLNVGRLILFGAIRELASDVRWGVEEVEDHQVIAHETELGVEPGIYNLEGPRRSFAGEFALLNTSAAELISLHRSARNRVRPWLLIPDQAVNDAWYVRFADTTWSRTREAPNHNIFPYRVRELSRGLPWP